MRLWLPMFNYNLLGGPLFEEFGWRGFLQAHLQKIMPSD
jgi:membrane protease YdiL (CAAX protease family)